MSGAVLRVEESEACETVSASFIPAAKEQRAIADAVPLPLRTGTTPRKLNRSLRGNALTGGSGIGGSNSGGTSASTNNKVQKLCSLKRPATSPELTLEQRRGLVEQHRPAARKLALSMITRWKCRIEPDELQSVIDLALCEAAMRYDQAHGAGFMTFLYYHLKGKLIKTIAARAEDALEFVDDYERPRPTLDSDSEGGIRSSEWRSLSFSDSEQLSLDDMLHRQQVYDLCYQACLRLKGIERDVIWRIYFENKELNQVTTEMGYSRGHLFRVRMKALEKIRRAVGTSRL